MKSYYILHNSWEKASRDFVGLYSTGNVVIDWYNDNQSRIEYLALGYPGATSFPSVVDPDTKRMSVNPGTLDLAIQALDVVPIKVIDELFNERVTSGFDTGKGYSLGLSDGDRVQFNALVTLLKEGLELATGSFNDTSSVDIADIKGVIHPVTIQECRETLLQYGLYYKYIWDGYKSGDASRLM